MSRRFVLRYNELMSTRRYYIEESDAPTATADQIALAEEIIDQYVGTQDSYFDSDDVRQGEITSLLSGNKIIDTSSISQLGPSIYINFYDRMVVEFLSGAQAGTIRPITASDSTDYSITYDGTALAGLAVGDIFKIYQLGKFPRCKDVLTRLNSDNRSQIYKSIPRQVKDAVIAQAEYIVELGDDYFTGNDTDAASESIGNYSYSNAGGGNQSATVKMVAPKARTLLRGIMSRLGRLEA